MSRVVVVSGRYPPTSFPSVLNHATYARLHGFTYVHCAWPTPQTNPYFNKIQYVLDHLDLADYLLWIDDDAFFLDFDQSIDGWLPTGRQWLTICASPTNRRFRTFISSGQFIVRSSPEAKEFFNAVLNADMQAVRRNWDETRYGLFTNGDQDAMTYVMHAMPTLLEGVSVLPASAFNARASDVLAGEVPFLVHFTGPLARKHADHVAVRRALKRHPTLVPDAVATHLGLALPTPSAIRRRFVGYVVDRYVPIVRKLQKWLLRSRT